MSFNFKQRGLSISDFYILLAGNFVLLAVLQVRFLNFRIIDWFDPLAWSVLVVSIYLLADTAAGEFSRICFTA